MIKLIRKLFGLCEHKWAVKHEYSLSMNNITKEYVYLQECEKCGRLNTYRV